MNSYDSKSQGGFALYAWAFTPVASLLGLYVPYPNQIRVFYGAAVAALLCAATRGFSGSRRELALGLLWPIGFGVAFIGVSLAGLDFENSKRFHVLYQPLLHGIPFLTWFVVARYFQVRRVLEALLVAALFMAAHSFGLLLLDTGSTRFLSDLSVPVGIASGAIVGVLFGSSLANVIAIAALLVALWLGMKKTVLVCGILGLLVSFVGIGTVHANRKRVGMSLAIAIILLAPLHLITLKGDSASDPGSILASEAVRTPNSDTDGEQPAPDASGEPNTDAPDKLQLPKTTIERFAEAPDPTRSALSRLGSEMLAQHFPHGIGYMSFMKASSHVIPYTTFTASGEQLSGVSLHNTYMHFVLEGGWSIVIIVVAASMVFVRALIRVYVVGDHQELLALVAWVLMAGLYGWFHQLYLTDYMFGLFGFALGASYSCANARATKDVQPH